MPIVKDEYKRCSECQNQWFVEEKYVAFPALIKSRDEDNLPLIPLETRFIYRCSKCGHIMDL